MNNMDNTNKLLSLLLFFQTKYDISNAIVNRKNGSITFIPEHGKEPNRKQSEAVAQSLYEIDHTFEQLLATNQESWMPGLVATAAATAAAAAVAAPKVKVVVIGAGVLALGVTSIIKVFKSLYQEYSRSERPMETDDWKEFTSLPRRRAKAGCPRHWHFCKETKIQGKPTRIPGIKDWNLWLKTSLKSRNLRRWTFLKRQMKSTNWLQCQAVIHKLELEILTSVRGKFSDFPCVLELFYSLVFSKF